MTNGRSLLVLGATGQTGQHLTRLALEQGHHVRALARTPAKLAVRHERLEVVAGSITDDQLDLDRLLDGVDGVVAMLGDRVAQQDRLVNTEFVQRLVPAMRRSGTRRFLYQAGGLSAVPGRRLALPLRIVRRTIAKSYDGQHRDNEAVMRYLDEQARDLEWMVHRAGIGSDGPSRGELRRSRHWISIGTFVDCAAYDLRMLWDDGAVQTWDGSAYARGR
ncbi:MULTISPECIES: NAD(P)-dependent oxidoreductase [Curtobacterium]|uniref:NAD(P)-dependent oxidoreductase n=1 Tax=Curtobacterium TaxID=2034 RepID=UPI000736A268|nr:MULTISPECIES: NAD(P)H-binding protein [Curtobacterium]KTR25092.1 NmrA family transcriptional regulator [Curtobacterium citreum]